MLSVNSKKNPVKDFRLFFKNRSTSTYSALFLHLFNSNQESEKCQNKYMKDAEKKRFY